MGTRDNQPENLNSDDPQDKTDLYRNTHPIVSSNVVDQQSDDQELRNMTPSPMNDTMESSDDWKTPPDVDKCVTGYTVTVLDNNDSECCENPEFTSPQDPQPLDGKNAKLNNTVLSETASMTTSVEDGISRKKTANTFKFSFCFRVLLLIAVLVLGGIAAIILNKNLQSPDGIVPYEPTASPRQLLVTKCKNPVFENTRFGVNLNYIVRLRFRPRDYDANEISNVYLEIFDSAGRMLGSTDLINGHQLPDGNILVIEFITEIRLSPNLLDMSSPDAHALIGKWSWQKGKWGDPKGWQPASEEVDIIVNCHIPEEHIA